MSLLTDNNPITANGTYDALDLTSNIEHRIELSGNFGGGTVSVQTRRGLEIASFSAAGGEICSFAGNAKFVLSGATSPSIEIDITELR
jgi:hypothetical protein|tara:strand:+ start:417 stop:680 length:264 start_codon:yes stop_codon:yes gene_type:complete